MADLEVSKAELLEQIVTSVEKIQDTQASIIEETGKISEHNIDPEAHPFLNKGSDAIVEPKKEVIYLSELPEELPEDLAEGGLIVVVNLENEESEDTDTEENEEEIQN